jgi:O-antigen/teichoic acid export membrane protein
LIVRRSAVTFGVQLLQLAGTVAVTILVTRVTGVQGKGMYTLVALVVSLSTLACGLGLSWASIYHIGRGTFPLARATGTVVTSSLMSGVLAVSVLGLAFILFRRSYFHELNATQIAIAIAITPVTQLTVGFGSILLGLNRVIQYAIVSLLQVLTTLTLQVGLAVAGRLTATTALEAWAGGAVVALLLAGSMAGLRAPVRPQFDLAIFRSYLSYGIKGYIANVMSLLNYRLDSLIVNGLIGVTQLGLYSIAVALAELLWYAANSISLVMFPHVSSLAREDANRITPVVARNTLMLTLIGAICMFIVGHWLILIVLGPAMLPAVVPLWLLLPGIVTLSAGKVIASYMSGIGRPIYATYISAFTVILTVILDIVLIPRYGIAGAAAASSIVYTIASALSVWMFVRESGSSWIKTLIVQREDLDRYRRLFSSMQRRLATARTARSRA